jgi:hypothetical protein
MSLPEIESYSISAVSGLNGFGERGWFGRSGDKVDVVGHEAISKGPESMDIASRFQESKVSMTVRIVEEDGLLVISAVADVVWGRGYDDSGESRHGRIIAQVGV